MVVGKVSRESYYHQSIIHNIIKLKDFSPEAHIIVVVFSLALSLSLPQFVLHFYTVRNRERFTVCCQPLPWLVALLSSLMFMPILFHWTVHVACLYALDMVIVGCFNQFVCVLPACAFIAVYPQPDLPLYSALCSGRSNDRHSGCGIRLWRGLYLT